MEPDQRPPKWPVVSKSQRPVRKLNRRSFLSRVAGGAVTAGALGLVGGYAARAQTGPYTGVTDNDSGSYADSSGHGRGPGGNAYGQPQSNPQTGVTDRDPSDPVGHGRGGSTGYSDSDSGPNADPSGRGTRGANAQTGYTDSDPSDRSGQGRGPDAARNVRGPQIRPDGRVVDYTGFTDSDGGTTRDPSGYGRGSGQRCRDTDYARSDAVIGGRNDTERRDFLSSDYHQRRVDPSRAC